MKNRTETKAMQEAFKEIHSCKIETETAARLLDRYGTTEHYKKVMLDLMMKGNTRALDRHVDYVASLED